MILLPTLVVNCGFALRAPYPLTPRFTEGVVTYTSMKWVLFWASASMLLSLGGCHHDKNPGVVVDAGLSADGETRADASAPSADLAVLADGPDKPPLPPAATQWTRLLGVGSSILGNSLATDRASNLYLSGAASVALEGNTYAGTGDVFIAKYDLNGDRLWIREMRLAIVDARDRDL